MERLIKNYWLLQVIIFWGCFISVIKAGNEAATTCACAPAWQDQWDRYIPNLSLLTATQRMVFLVDSDVEKAPTDTFLVAVPATLVSKFVSKIPNLKPFATNSKFYVEMLAQKYRGLSKQGHSYIWDLHIANKVQVAEKIIKEATGCVSNLISDWNVTNLIAYNSLVQNDLLESANYFKLKQMSTTVNYPQNNLNLFADWYLPIYEQYGGNETIQRFIEVINSRYFNINNSGLLLNKVTVSHGEFVHIWSQAAKTDLRDLAYQAFGWTPEYRRQFATSRKTLSPYNYTDVYPNASLYKPPEDWINQGRNLTLAHSNDHVAFYFDESVSHNVTWPFKIASDAWSYVKSAYNYSGSDPILYIILENGEKVYTSETTYTFSKENSYLNKTYVNRLVLDYHTVLYDSTWTETHDPRLQDRIVEGIGKVARAVFKETGNIPLRMLDSGLTEIFALDIYLGTENRENAIRYKKASQMSNDTRQDQESQSFLEWYYQVYTEYGRTAVLKRFLSSLYEFWPRRGTDYSKQIRRAELVHFWSGATGVDLTSSAIKAFGMSSRDISLLNQARLDYPMLNYTREIMRENVTQTWEEHWCNHKAKLNLGYFDDHVAFYLDPSFNQSISWLTSFISDGWKYAKATYGDIGLDPRLYVILHGGSSENISYCLVSRADRFYNRDLENRNVIDYVLPRNSGNNFDTEEKVQKMFIINLAELIQKGAKGGGTWPGDVVCANLFYTIIFYDILVGLGRPDTAQLWYAEIVSEYKPRNTIYTSWSGDWYYSIYSNYGGSSALNNFLDVLSTHWPHENDDHLSQLNWGEWVHFWSAAVGENLLHMAYEFEQFGVDEYSQYLRARNNYRFNYTDVYQNERVVLPPETFTEKHRGPEELKGTDKEELKMVYRDAHVAIYCDADMASFITWPFKSLSAAWAHAKRVFGPFSSDPLLYALFHNGPHVSGCQTYKDRSYADYLYGNKSLINCGHHNNPWNPPERLEVVIRKVAKIITLTAKETGSWPAEMTYNYNAIESILMYDLYKAIGKKTEARELLKSSVSGLGHYEVQWERDWHYPIYTKYGQAQVLGNFFSLLHAHFPKTPSGLDYARELNLGEYVHFWSGAAGDNLTDWAQRAKILARENDTELQEAMLNFPLVTYKASNEIITKELSAIFVNESEFGHTEFIFQQYTDSNINVYLDLDVDTDANWTFPFLSKSWQYTKSTYETARTTASPILKTVLHASKYKGCKTLLVRSNDTANGITTIDCGSDTSDKWSTDSHENKYDLLSEYSNLIQKSAKQPDENTPYVRKEFSKLILFDLFMAQGMLEEAHGILRKGYNETEVQSGRSKFWVCDWFLLVYSKYGGVSVLNKFLALLPTHWNLRGSNSGTTTMNVGQLVHFWSAAAGESVLNVAQDTFGRGSQQRDNLNEAKKDFLLPLYLCYDCYYDGFETSTSERLLITGLSLGFSGIVTTVVIISVYLYRQKVNKLQAQIRDLTIEEMSEFFDGISNVTGEDRYACIESEPFNKDYEISRDRLEICFANVLGAGEFAVVFQGMLKSPSGEDTAVVAVKTVKQDVDVACFKALLMELKVMCYLGKHDNIACLLGSHTVNIQSREVYIVLEFCANGDLLTFLKNNRSNFTSLLPLKQFGGPNNENSVDPFKVLNPTDVEISSNYLVSEASTYTFSTLTLLEWSVQIANGMNYIASKKVIHGDLAARNVLLTSTNVAKISDFGLSRQLLNYSTYIKTSKTPIPWRWMAIESLRDMNYSVKSDTWAFGVTLYEIFSLGITPYAGWTWDRRFIDKLVEGHRLSEPEFGNQEIHTVMKDCMKITPDERIGYEQLILRFQDIKNKISGQSEDVSSLEGE